MLTMIRQADRQFKNKHRHTYKDKPRLVMWFLLCNNVAEEMRLLVLPVENQSNAN